MQTTPRPPLTRHQLAAIIGMSILGGLAALTVLLTPFSSGNAALERLYIGITIGTLFGQTTLAAAWTALGPGPLALRLPLALVWLCVPLFCFGVFQAWPHDDLDVAFVMGLGMAVQWTCSQLPLWCMTLTFGLHLRPYDEPGFREPRRQFGILQLMIFTGIVSVLLGVGRMLLAVDWDLPREAPIFLFLAAAALVMTLPLVFAAFLSRYAYPAIAAAVLFVILVTAAELPVLQRSLGNNPGPDLMHLVWINLFTAAWVFAGLIYMRICGYRFGALEDPPPMAWNETIRRQEKEVVPAEFHR